MMPKGAEILCVQTQYGNPTIWALCSDSAEKESRQFVMYGTGHLIDSNDDLKYIGTFQVSEGMGIFHLFELI